jgi:hypothetical protein
MANYPKNLAARVHAFLARSGIQAPGPGVLDRLFQILYFASLKTEEAEPISCRVAFVDRNAPDPDPPERITPDRWQCFALEQDLPCTVRNLAKLSKAADPWSSTIAVGVDPAASLRIWGVIDQSVHHSTFVVQETKSGQSMPGLFQATIEGIGEIAAYKDYEFLGRLRQDVMVTREVEVLQRGPIREKLLPSIRRYQTEVKRAVGAALYNGRGHWNESLEDEWISALCRVLIGIQRYGHGGAVLLSNRSAGLAPRYSIKYPRLSKALLMVAATQIRATTYSDKIMEEHVGASGPLIDRSIPADLYLDESVAEDDLEDMRCEITGSVRFLSSLGRVDGLVRLRHNLTLDGFGVFITTGEEPDRVLKASDAAGTKTSSVDLNNLGTRHRSMIRQCAKDAESVGFVISQDGDVRAITKVGDAVLIWDNIALQRLYNAKAIKSRQGAFRLGPTED